MSNLVHIVPPEEIMAFFDDELPTEGAPSISSHLAECAGCRQFADSLRGQSESLTNWTVPLAISDPQFEDRLLQAARKLPSASSAGGIRVGKFMRHPALWALVGSVAATLLFFTVSTVSLRSHEDAAQTQAYNQPVDFARTDSLTTDQLRSQVAQSEELRDRLIKRLQLDSLSSSLRVDQPPGLAKMPAAPGDRVVEERELASPAPMIARTVSLSITVKDFAFSRTALDAILARHNGYSAQLNVNTAEGSARTLQASLRIPAPQLAAAVAELKSLGRVESETQNGEEVSQQHADLVARLKNSRETEQRLQAILVQRTGKISDVLAVEQEIARVRGEIEQMEGEQKSLEHRVGFSTIDLNMGEEYKAQINSPSSSVSTRFHNALVTGCRDALGIVIGIILFFAQYTPSLLVWLVLVLPVAWFVRRRWLRIRAIDASLVS